MNGSGAVWIVGQGLAGTLLAWSLERAGREFVIADQGHETSASRVGAGLVNPVTGEHWASAPGWAAASAAARAAYREIEEAWGLSLVSELRIRRSFRDHEEAARVRRKVAGGALRPWARPEGLGADAAWIEGAWRVDLPALIAAGRTRWRGQGRLRETRLEPARSEDEPRRTGPVIWCVGAAEARLPELRAVGGETLELEVAGEGWREDVVRHDGVWVLPVGGGRAWAGASFVREEAERTARREELRASVRRQLSDLDWRERTVLAGWRMTTPNRRPRSGWLPGEEGRSGVFNGLGSKGALVGPALAAEWEARLAARPA